LEILELEKDLFADKDIKELLRRIFLVCKTEPTFQSQNYNNIDKNISSLESKLARKESILIKVQQYKKDILQKIEDLDQRNLSLKSKLLQKLGSEL
jgi:hypothetical protein